MPRAPSPQVSDQMWRLPTPRSSYQLRSASVPLTPLMVTFCASPRASQGRSLCKKRMGREQQGQGQGQGQGHEHQHEHQHHKHQHHKHARRLRTGFPKTAQWSRHAGFQIPLGALTCATLFLIRSP